MKLCAGRVGRLLNVADIATNCGISQSTAHRWLSILEASYIIFLLKPHVNSFDKRITKTPKLFFYDTGLACNLLGIRSAQELSMSPWRGHLFENLIISDLYKQYYNLGLEAPLYFWRDQNGRIEVDCLIDLGLKLLPIEIKSAETIVRDFFEGLSRWADMAHQDQAQSYVIYGGQSNQTRSKGRVLGWKSAGSLVERLETKE
jgi:predicted AAA+ superfamily ATPase